MEFTAWRPGFGPNALHFISPTEGSPHPRTHSLMPIVRGNLVQHAKRHEGDLRCLERLNHFRGMPSEANIQTLLSRNFPARNTNQNLGKPVVKEYEDKLFSRQPELTRSAPNYLR